MKYQDDAEREQALAPAHSFIVQAPAGSGKTELLTQRFLVLLGLVQQPEEILAITFTKKSAAEMRTRILHALQKAQDNHLPETEHAKRTLALAQKVLQQDNKLHWNLLTNPNRLRLQTIDSFNSSLTQRLPVLSQYGAPLELVEDATPLYRQAVQEVLSHLEKEYDWSSALAIILLHLDNNLTQLESLLISLLAKRDQWLRHVQPARYDPQLRENLEAELRTVVAEKVHHLKAHFPQEHQAELLTLARYANCIDLTSLPNNKPDWLKLSELLLTKETEWRKEWKINNGFPPASHFKNPEEKKIATEMKQRIKNLVEKLSENQRLKKIFKELRHSPDTHYQDSQWETLSALHQVLMVAAENLKLVFQQHGKIDYIGNALAALTALGTEDTPTDLTLALDYQIKHILIDEFQDTSNTQYELLKKITSGWEPNDGRTLFLVGDPMQSIYRFREAEVGIFIRAQKEGIGQIQLTPLRLSVNFRSTATVIDWLNIHFPKVLAEEDDIETGAVSYNPSIAHKNDVTSAVTLHAFSNEEDTVQAQAIVELIQQRQKIDPDGSIAILVRSRSHLKNIIPALKQAKLVYSAIDIDPLSERPFIQDLMALTRALLYPADRIAWLSILRAPWCGLSLHDLLLLSGKNEKILLWERLQSEKVIQTLSEEGQARINRILPILKIKVFERQRLSLRQWIESTWLCLGGPACLSQETDLENIEMYFKLLDKIDQSQGLMKTDDLDIYVNALRAAPNPHADHRLQIMTIHNAKGLEFDTIILPHLERTSSKEDKQLLLWMERQHSQKNSGLMIAPVHAIGEKTDSIYEYIKRQHVLKNEHERGRLLYVAATRAKKNLELFFQIESTAEKPSSSSLLAKLWPSIKNNCLIQESTIPIQEAAVPIPQLLKRLTLDFQNPIQENSSNETLAYHQKKAGFLLPDTRARYIGTLIHQLLEKIANFGPAWWTTQSTVDQAAYIKSHLLNLGMIQGNYKPAVEEIRTAINSTLNDTKGQWILSQHSEAKTEYSLTTAIDGVIQQLVIDRTFVDENNIRWIIDYKTSQNSQETLETFLLSEKEKYHQKMYAYFKAMQKIENRSIRLGLYFPCMPAWYEWDFSV